MNSYIRNKLIFTGTEDEMKALEAELKDGDVQLSFNKIIPLSDEAEKEAKWGILLLA